MPKGVYQRPERKCSQCGKEPYVTPSKIKSRDYRCFNCYRKSQQRWKRKNIEYVREYERNTYKKCPEKFATRNNRYPDKLRARLLLRRAVYAGRIEKLPCVYCGNNNVHGHHTDYSKPYEVVWVCSQHHSDIHRGVIHV